MVVKKQADNDPIVVDDNGNGLDPFALLKQVIYDLTQRQGILEQQMANLQSTWNRILNVSQEEAPAGSRQQPQQPVYSHPAQQPQQSVAQQPAQQAVDPIVYAPWHEDPQAAPAVNDGNKVATSQASSKRRRLIWIVAFVLAALVLVLLIALKSAGWSCAFLPI